MRKKIISAVLALLMCLSVFSMTALAEGESITASCEDGETVEYEGSGFAVSTDYVLRIAATDPESLVRMENVKSDEEGSISGTVELSGLVAEAEYRIFIDGLSGGTVAESTFTVGGEDPGTDPDPGPGPGPSVPGIVTPPTTSSGITVNGKEVSWKLNEDGSVTLSESDISGYEKPFVMGIPYTLEEGADANAVVAVLKGEDSEDIIVLSKYADGMLYFYVFEAGTYAVRENAVSFSDLGEAEWAADYIEFVAARGLFTGVSESSYNPNGKMTRAMLAVVLARLDGADLSAYSESRFSDVEADSWYMTAVEWAAENGIVNGTGEDTFSPNADITREEVTVMLVRYLAMRGYELAELEEAPEAFIDAEDIQEWAAEAVEQIQKAGIMNGKPAEGGNAFAPQDDATRAELAAIFARLIEALLK